MIWWWHKQPNSEIYQKVVAAGYAVQIFYDSKNTAKWEKQIEEHKQGIHVFFITIKPREFPPLLAIIFKGHCSSSILLTRYKNLFAII